MAFNKIRDLEKAIMEVYQEALTKAGEIAKKELHTRVMVDFYMRNDNAPKKNEDGEYYYERTYELINSLTLTVKKDKRNQITTHVYFDVDKIRPSAQVNNFSGFYAHASFGGAIKDRNGRSISSLLLQWIEEGNSGHIGNNPINGIHFLQSVNDYLENGELEKVIKKVFKSYGLTLNKI